MAEGFAVAPIGASIGASNGALFEPLIRVRAFLAGAAAVAAPPADAAIVVAGIASGGAGGISTSELDCSSWATGSASGSAVLAAAGAFAPGQPGNTGLLRGGACGKESPSDASRSATNAFSSLAGSDAACSGSSSGTDST